MEREDAHDGGELARVEDVVCGAGEEGEVGEDFDEGGMGCQGW